MKEIEKDLIELQKANEENVKMLLALEWIIGIITIITFLLMIFVSIFAIENINWQIINVITGSIIFMVGCASCIYIEQKAGYYECSKCHNKYVPTYKQVLFAMHCGRTRYMKCPKCDEKSWNKKSFN